MDIPGLKAELEEQLKRISHADAPGGFRDRFEQAVEHHEAEHDPEDKSELEAQLRRIRGIRKGTDPVASHRNGLLFSSQAKQHLRCCPVDLGCGSEGPELQRAVDRS